MAARFSVGEVLDFIGLSESDSSAEEGEEVCAYRGKASLDLLEVEALSEAVPPNMADFAGSSALGFKPDDSSGGEEVEEDIQGKNVSQVSKLGLIIEE